METIYAHEVTAASLHILQHQAYNAYFDEDDTVQRPLFETWCHEKAKAHPQFEYWSMIQSWS